MSASSSVNSSSSDEPVREAPLFFRSSNNISDKYDCIIILLHYININ